MAVKATPRTLCYVCPLARGFICYYTQVLSLPKAGVTLSTDNCTLVAILLLQFSHLVSVSERERAAVRQTERHLMKPTRKLGKQGSNPNETNKLATCAAGGQQKSRGRKRSNIGRKRPGGEKVHCFCCLRRMPFSLEAISRFHSVFICRRKDVHALVHTIPHIYSDEMMVFPWEDLFSPQLKLTLPCYDERR